MQHKHYFVALLCGALCLTGCLKNEESLSVTEVRNAKANELNAQAELLKAQATAETVMANAQAELLKAQAEVEKAKATKIKAEADLIQVQADIAAIQVEMEKVNVSIRKKELEMKELELQGQAKLLELLIAQCDAALAEIAAELDALQKELEIAEIEHALNLATTQQEYEQFLAEQAEALSEAEYDKYVEAVTMYFWLQTAINEAQIQITQNELTIEQLNAAEDAAYEQVLDDYMDALAQISILQAYVEKAQQYVNFDEDELKEEVARVDTLLFDAYNDYAAAVKAYGDAEEELDKLYATFNPVVLVDPDYSEFEPRVAYYRYAEYANNGYIYDEDNYPYPGYEWADFFTKAGAVAGYLPVTPANEDSEYTNQWGTYDEDGKWVPIFYGQYDAGKWAAMAPDEETIESWRENGVYGLPVGVHFKSNIVPAHTELKAFNDFVAAYEKDLKDEFEADTAAAIATAANVKAFFKGQKDQVDSWIAEYKKYVDVVEPKFKAAEEKVASTGEAFGKAFGELFSAGMEVQVASIDNHTVEEAYAVMTAEGADYDAQVEAFYAGYNFVEGRPMWPDEFEGEPEYGAYADSIMKAGILNYTEHAYVSYYATYVSEYAVYPDSYNPYDADPKVIDFDPTDPEARAAAFKIAEDHYKDELNMRQGKLNEANNALEALKTDYGTAKTATETAQSQYDAAVADFKAAKEKYWTAYAVWVANPTEATETAKNTAKTDMDTAEGNVGTKYTALENAQKAYTGTGAGTEADSIEEKYNTAKADVEYWQAIYNQWKYIKEGNPEADPESPEYLGWDGRLKDAGDNNAEAAAACVLDRAAMDAAQDELDKAIEDFKAAVDALAATEKTAFATALTNFTEASNAWQDAQTSLDSLTAIYTNYPTYSQLLDEENEYSLVNMSKNLAQLMEDCPALYNGEDVENLDIYLLEREAEYDLDVEEAEWVKATINTYEQNYSAAYEEAVEAYNKQAEVVAKAYVDKWLANFYLESLKQEKEGLVTINYCLDEDGNPIDVLDYIAGLQAQIDVINDALDAEIEAYQYDYDNIFAIQRLELENSQLEDCIDLWEIELDKYIEIIQAWISQNAA